MSDTERIEKLEAEVAELKTLIFNITIVVGSHPKGKMFLKILGLK